MRYAAIDIGSNAVRLLIANIFTDTKKATFKKTSLVRVPLRLGDDAFIDKRISDAKSGELIKTMIAFRHLMDVYKVEDYMACATSAMREAENGPELVKRIFDEAKVKLEIVEGQKEANIIYSTHIAENLELDKDYLYVDVGGGSTELSIFSGAKIVDSKSFQVGTVRMLDNADLPETWNDMNAWIKSHSRKYKDLIGIGTGGNINKLYRLSEEKQGRPLSFNKLNDIYSHLKRHSLKERITVLGLNQDRADVIVPACEIYLKVMKWASVKNIYVPNVGVVDGIIQLMIDRNLK